MNAIAPRESTNHSVRWYAERELWVLLLLAVAIYLPRLTTLTIRGEESRRAVIAREMMESGDWIVPRTQGVVRVSRPPFQNWLIAGVAMFRGEVDAWAIRLPGAISTLATVMLVYWYSRQRLSRTGAFVAAAAYASLLQVLEQGRTGETEPVVTALIAASLLVWHGGWTAGWKKETAWAAGAAFAGLAMLTKGLQAPLYFFGSTWAYLALTGQHRWLWHRSHLCGLAAFAGVVACWQIPFTVQMGWENTWLIYFSNVAKRFNDDRLTTFLAHLVTYPPSVICGCLAPWSLFLLLYLDPQVRSRLGNRRDMATFLLIGIAVCFPSVWWPPEARPRYFMPLFPCFAVLIGLAVELLCEQPTVLGQRVWTTFVRGGVIAMVLAAAGLIGWSVLAPPQFPAPSLRESAVYALIAASLSVILSKIGTQITESAIRRAALCMLGFLGLLAVGPFLSNQDRRSEDLPAAMAAFKTALPDDVRLVSFDRVHHLFVYHLDRKVDVLPWPQTADDLPSDADYFCVDAPGKTRPELPFAWEEVASLPVDRNHHAVPKDRVIVGRRIAEPAINTAAKHVEPAR
ncbi:MAG: glycosyltransferase family 39 protein [Planctomycetaceae bacterium]|nr:glycosyltransferase family 39 protein [Planctomycetaceae bacterium]